MIRLMTDSILHFLADQPSAFAHVRGSEAYPDIRGLVTFYDFLDGTIVMADIGGLPQTPGDCPEDFFAFHIHEGASCTGTPGEPFADAGGHYNPWDCIHPGHAGDMPVLEGNRGRAWTAFYTERFKPYEIRGKTVILHSKPDDYHTQPSGAAGEMMACGVIQ